MRPITFAGMLMFIGPDMALAFGFYEEGSETILVSAGSTEDMIDEMLGFARVFGIRRWTDLAGKTMRLKYTPEGDYLIGNEKGTGWVRNKKGTRYEEIG